MSNGDFSRRLVSEGRTGTGRLAQRESVIYFAQRASDGAIKIGTTTDLKHRIYRLRNHEHDQIEVIGVVPGNRHQEAQFHRALIDDAIGGEWFKPTARVLKAAAGELLRAGDFDPFVDLPKPPLRRVVPSPSPGGSTALRNQILECWQAGLSGRDCATTLQIAVSKLTREVKLMTHLGYFNSVGSSSAASPRSGGAADPRRR